MNAQPELIRQAIGFLASTIPADQSRRMEENHETLRYAYNTNWTIAETQGLIQRPKAGKAKTYPKSHRQDVAGAAYARIKGGESLYSVAKSLCMQQGKLRGWLQAHTDFTTIGALRGAEL